MKLKTQYFFHGFNTNVEISHGSQEVTYKCQIMNLKILHSISLSFIGRLLQLYGLTFCFLFFILASKQTSHCYWPCCLYLFIFSNCFFLVDKPQMLPKTNENKTLGNIHKTLWLQFGKFNFSDLIKRDYHLYVEITY